jgi:hypothetical protein
MVVNNKGQKGQKAKQASQAKLETKKPAIMSNAAFLYPRARDDGDFVNSGSGATTIKRGYVRRLTEFYNKTPEGATDNPTVLNSLKCLFQFNPDSITRSIQSDTSMQLFFNQEPAQLAQPVPGKAGFAFELLFNREAEVNSGTYLVGGKPTKVDLPNINTEYEFQGAMKNFLEEPYNPAWVTKLGVLADIMILDDILGVGLSQDVVNAVFPKEGTASLNLQEDTYEKVDEDDKEKTKTEAVYNKNRMNSFVQNLGNKAFLVPQPIRVVFSNWMIIEGFVTSSQVTFNKYTRSFIPTQCSVAIQMQALYIGFAQENTFLTDIQKVPTETPGVADVPAAGTSERIMYDDTKIGLNKFLDKASWRMGQSGVKKVSSFFSKTDPSESLNFEAETTKEGQAFYTQMVKESKAAGAATFTFSGELKIWWHSHVTNANINRTVGGIPATTAGGADLIYASGPPPTVGEIDYTQWGTLLAPVIIKIDDHPIYYSQNKKSKYDDLNYGRISGAGNFVGYGVDAVWRWEIADAILPRPFTQDKFNVELKITTFCTRPGISPIKLPQIIQMRSTVMYDEDMKLNPLTVAALPITQKDRKV